MFASAKKILPEERSDIPLLNGLVIFQTSQCLPLDVATPSELKILTKAKQVPSQKDYLQVVDENYQAKDRNSSEANLNDSRITKLGNLLESKTNSVSQITEKPVIEQKQNESLLKKESQNKSLTPEKDSSLSEKNPKGVTNSSSGKSHFEIKTKTEKKGPDAEARDDLSKSQKLFLEKEASKDISKFDKDRDVALTNAKMFQYLEELDPELEAPSAKEIKSIYKNVVEENFVKRKKIGTFSFSSIWGRKKDKQPKTSNPPKKISNVSHGEELNYFFRATDDQLLYNLGESFHRDYKKGIKHFAFAHVNSDEPQKRSILGVASLLKYFENNRILIITSKMDESYFAPFKKESTPQLVEISGLPGFKYTVHKSYSLFYLEVEELAQRSQFSKVNVLSTVIKCLMADYDVVICDLPPLEERKDQYDIYLPLLQIIENVTLTISLEKSRFSEINELREYFSSYKIRIKGSVVERHSEPRRATI